MYRVILPFDEKVINVGTDMDFNTEGEVKTPLTDNVSLKGEWVVRNDPSSIYMMSLELGL